LCSKIYSTILAFIREIYGRRMYIPDDTLEDNSNNEFSKITNFLSLRKDQIEHYSLKRHDFKMFMNNNNNTENFELDCKVDVYHPDKFINVYQVGGFKRYDLS